MHPASYTKYQRCSLVQACGLAVTAIVHKKEVYIVGQLLVTESRTYWVSDTTLEGERLAWELGVQTVDEAGEFYWPRHPVVAWVRRMWKRITQ